MGGPAPSKILKLRSVKKGGGDQSEREAERKGSSNIKSIQETTPACPLKQSGALQASDAENREKGGGGGPSNLKVAAVYRAEPWDRRRTQIASESAAAVIALRKPGRNYKKIDPRGGGGSLGERRSTLEGMLKKMLVGR